MMSVQAFRYSVHLYLCAATGVIILWIPEDVHPGEDETHMRASITRREHTALWYNVQMIIPILENCIDAPWKAGAHFRLLLLRQPAEAEGSHTLLTRLATLKKVWGCDAKVVVRAQRVPKEGMTGSTLRTTRIHHF